MIPPKVRMLLVVAVFAVAGQAIAAEPTILDFVEPGSRDAVSDVIRQPTLTASATEPGFRVRPELYDWLLDHPDRASAAWRRMGYPCVPIEPRPGGWFHWEDDQGSTVDWKPVARFADGVVWFASGSIKRGALLPAVPITAVAVLRAPRTPGSVGESATVSPTLRVYMATDSRAAATVLRLLGPAVPRMAEQGADQVLMFFSGPARYADRHPEKAAELFRP